MNYDEIELENWFADTGYGEVEGTLIVDYKLTIETDASTHHGPMGGLMERHISEYEVTITDATLYYICPTTELERELVVELEDDEIKSISELIINRASDL